jgi:oligopeptide/dipeptide ABC transporter ATP-binding protein
MRQASFRLDDIILKVENLVAAFDTEDGQVRAVDDVSFSLHRGRNLGIVGESGCGKSVTALSIMRLLPRPVGKILAGRIAFKGTDILALPPGAMHAVRGNQIAMIFQEPMTALNPVHAIGRQVGEVFKLHFPAMSDADTRKASLEMLQKVGIPEPLKRMHEYPHQISGGMRQRVMIAMALACKPDILIADEPTTALDVTIQAQILDLIRTLQAETGMSVIFITHDLGVIAELCDAVVVMYAGKVAETAPIRELFQNPRHPYTRGLLNSIPTLDAPHKQPLRIIEGVVPSLDDLPPGCRFENRCPHVRAVCASALPPLVDIGPEHAARCYFAMELEPWQKTSTDAPGAGSET